MLALVGFAATGLYWPGVSAAATTPRWAALFLIVPWLLRGGNTPSAAYIFGAAFMFIAALSMLWTPDQLSGVDQLLILLLASALFCLGDETEDLRPFYIGAGLGLSLSSAVAIVQALGWEPLPVLGHVYAPSGLFINGNYLAEAAALVLVAAVSERIWWMVPLLAPALVLPQARGAILAALIGIGVCYRRSAVAWVVLAAIAAGAVWFALHPGPGTSERLLIWQSAFNGLTFSGHGIGSFWSAYPDFDLRAVTTHPVEFAHNEWLHIAFELGVPGLLCAILLAWSLAGPLDTARLVLIALFVESCLAFPLHLPATLAIGMVVAGHTVRNWGVSWSFAKLGRDAVEPSVGKRANGARFDRPLDHGDQNFPVGAPVSGWTSPADRN